MSSVPDNLRYASSHEWMRAESDGSFTVGISDFAQEQLGDLVFLEVPEVGRKVEAGEAVAVVESVKAASDVYAPVAGEVVAANDGLADALVQVNKDPYNAWLFRIRPANAADVQKLMDAAAYTKSIG
ncbi:MAG: glycine cleavage system protein GcvH [Betaproteobacteria bacterium]|nr:glycine cleavage system protein GcvH [Betaproteobacteria bacterium]